MNGLRAPDGLVHKNVQGLHRNWRRAVCELRYGDRWAGGDFQLTDEPTTCLLCLVEPDWTYQSPYERAR